MATIVAHLPNANRKPPHWQADCLTGRDRRGAYSQNPETREKWYPHPEDSRHWDYYDSDRGKRFPQEAKKPWQGQKRLRKGQKDRPVGKASTMTPSSAQRLNEIIRLRREAKSLSLSELSRKLGITTESLRDIEDYEDEIEEAPLWLTRKLSSLLGIPAERFFTTEKEDT